MKKFNPDESLAYWTHRTAFVFRSLFDERADVHGVKWVEGVILMKLSRGHDTLADLSRNLDQSHPAILRHIDRLEEFKLVLRTGHPEDRRIKILVLTDAGIKKARALQEMVAQLSSELEERFGADRVSESIALFKEIVAAYAKDGRLGCPNFDDQTHSTGQAGYE